jgi:REP element-mobilizing transposase RayT
MSRPPRTQFPGAFYHVTARGNRKANIFLDDLDYLTWHSLVARAAERFGFVAHAYCQMPNHFHLVLETPLTNLSEIMHFLNCVYSLQFNARHGLSGHVLQGRFHSVLLEREAHFLELARYVTLNPVRAGLVQRAEDWRWSNYRATAGMAEAPAWLNTEATRSRSTAPAMPSASGATAISSQREWAEAIPWRRPPCQPSSAGKPPSAPSPLRCAPGNTAQRKSPGTSRYRQRRCRESAPPTPKVERTKKKSTSVPDPEVDFCCLGGGLSACAAAAGRCRRLRRLRRPCRSIRPASGAGGSSCRCRRRRRPSRSPARFHQSCRRRACRRSCRR